MATQFTSSSVAPELGDLLTVEVHPTWLEQHKDYWLDGNPIGSKLSFAFVDLEEGISEESAPNYADTDVVGRAEQYKTYVGSSNREWQFTFHFQVQGLPENVQSLVSDRSAVAQRLAGGPGRSVSVDAVRQNQMLLLLEKEVVNPALWLDSLKHPLRGAGDLTYAPPPVLLTVGRLIRAARCIVTSCTLRWKAPFDPGTLMPHGAEVQVTFTNVRTHIRRNLFLHQRKYW